MQLQGFNLIGFHTSGQGGTSFQGVDPATGQELGTMYRDATETEIERAARLAEGAFQSYRNVSPQQRATFLDAVADALEGQGERIVKQAHAETALGEGRLHGELARTTGQLRMFAKLVREGSWVDARIDHADPDRSPQPKPDVRRMLKPIGPVAVFGASNFPLAFSVAGGDTASALAAGCPVIVKAHPAHPGTSELVGRIILETAQEEGMPEGVFSLLHGRSHEVSLALVRHPTVRAVGFTGSLQGGRALFDAAARRPDPIPVYAEMGSINPVFLLPGALAERHEAIATGMAGSVTLGVGQFCTNPGLIVALESSELDAFIDRVAAHIADTEPGVMLYDGIRQNFEGKTALWQTVSRVSVAGCSSANARSAGTQVPSFVFTTTARTFLEHPNLHEEVFGPSTLVVKAEDRAELLEVARALEGQLTATIHGEAEELGEYSDLVETLQEKAGRLIFNGFPTGVEVGHAMHHGGPYPATTEVRSTSVGTAAIHRFARPVCFQNFPQEALPPELKDGNPRGILRMVDGVFQRSQPCS